MAQTLSVWIEQHSKNAPRASSTDGIELVVASLAKTSGPEDVAVLGRLGDLGLVSGEPFEYFGRSPLGEPVYICVRDTVIALRMDEASLIEIVSEITGAS